MNSQKLIVLAVLLAFSFVPGLSHGFGYVESSSFGRVIHVGVENIKDSQYLQVPLITWGGDIVAILANGSSTMTTDDSIFGRKGLKLKLVRQDNFKKQVEAYLKGETPYLRGTMGMINMAAEVISGDNRTKPIIIYQMTWSSGGDCLVVKPGIQTAKDLKGKNIALQAYGPHVDYLSKILKDAGLSMKDVNIKWTSDLTGTDNSPAEALYEKDVHAAFVIIPDGLMLTSNGTVGTGAEGSIKGARIMLSTKTANRIIADVYAVRSDYFKSHYNEVKDFVHGLMIAKQQLKALVSAKESRMPEYKKTFSAAAEILLDSAQATGDAQALYGDCEYTGFAGNVKFFGDTKWPRNINRLTDEIQSAFITIGLLGKKVSIEHAGWNYDNFKPGLTDIDKVDTHRFRKAEVAKVVAKKQAMGTLNEGELFSFEINFKPNQNIFSEDIYADEFEKIVNLGSTYGGAVITVEGHSDPHKYNKLKKKKADSVVLKRTKQAAKNLSMNRALSVRKSIIKFAKQNNVSFDDSQFAIIGHGISEPKFPNPKTKEQWLSNMRVMFRIIQVEAEDSVFEPME